MIGTIGTGAVRAIDFRLPGVTFLPRLTESRLPLPRLDVAAFVGFAERGPLHLPVLVEDLSAYRAIFGGDLPLARDTAGGTVYANLPSTVQAFFANGGRRCYVVRVAGDHAGAARYRVPGLVAVDAVGLPGLAAISASSPGAWGAQLRLAARQSAIALPTAAFRWAELPGDEPVLEADTGVLRLSGLPALQSGDILQLALQDGSGWLAVIATDQPSTPATSLPPLPGPGEPPALLRLRSIFRYLEQLDESPPAMVEQMELLALDGASALASTGPLVSEQGQTVLALHQDDAPRLSSGDIVRLYLEDRPTGDRGYLARIAEVRATTGSGLASPPEPIYEIVLGNLLQLTPETLPLSSPPSVDGGYMPIESITLLRLDLLLRLGELSLPAITDLAYDMGHPRFWGDAILLESSLHGPRTNQRQPAPSRDSTVDTHVNVLSESANWFRRLTADPYDLAPLSGQDRNADSDLMMPRNFDPANALAGLLAPVGSGLGLTWETAQLASERARVAEEPALTYLPIDMPALFDEASSSQFLPPEPGRAGTDDLQILDVSVFVDKRLGPSGFGGLGESHRTLMRTAFDLRYLQGRRLRGIHSLLFIDEIALISTPDAAHHPWEPDQPQPEPAPPKPAKPVAEEPCPPEADFVACNRTPSIDSVEPHFGPLDVRTTVLVNGEGFAAGSQIKLFFGLRPAEEVQVLSSTELIASAPTGIRPEPVDVRVENQNGSAALADGFIYTRRSTMPRLPVAIPPGILDSVDDAPFLAIHQALAILCQARADVTAVFSLPIDYQMERCLAWQQALRRRLGLSALDERSIHDEPVEIADLSYVSVFHPWLLIAGNQSSDAAGGNLRHRVRPVPPDGAICGLIAMRERTRSVWIAPANVPLSEILGLQSTFSNDEWATLFARRFNLIRDEANGVRPMSAHTLSGDRSLLQISVRRLLILLRRAAIRLGMDFVFESNHEIFREGVRAVLEELLRYLYERGAFAGRTEAGSFRVITDASVNTPQSIEQGHFVAVIQVAPSQPMEFVTVQLTRSDRGELLAVEA